MIQSTQTAQQNEVLSRLIPYSFESFNEDFLEKVLTALPLIKDTLANYTEPKDRTKGLRVIGSNLSIELTRKNDNFLLLEAIAVVNIYNSPEGQAIIYSRQNFLQEFPEFSGLLSGEIDTLCAYRNMMAVAIKVIPAKWNYNHLLDLVARISEGRKVRYITGSGATDQTKYRMIIYEKVGGIPRQKRPSKTMDMCLDMLDYPSIDGITTENSDNTLSSSGYYFTTLI